VSANEKRKEGGREGGVRLPVHATDTFEIVDLTALKLLEESGETGVNYVHLERRGRGGREGGREGGIKCVRDGLMEYHRHTEFFSLPPSLPPYLHVVINSFYHVGHGGPQRTQSPVHVNEEGGREGGKDRGREGGGGTGVAACAFSLLRCCCCGCCRGRRGRGGEEGAVLVLAG